MTVMVDETLGPVPFLPPDKPSNTTAYLVPSSRPLLFRLGLAGRRSRWLPLWQWEAGEKLVHVWDYSRQAAAEAEERRRSAFGSNGRPADSKGSSPAIPPPTTTTSSSGQADSHTVWAFACEQSGSPPLAAAAQVACIQLAKQAAAAAGGAPAAAAPAITAAARAGEPRIACSYSGGALQTLTVRRPPLSVSNGGAVVGNIDAASIELQLEMEPPQPASAAGHQPGPPAAAVGTVTLDFGTGAAGLRAPAAGAALLASARPLQSGTHAVAFLRSARSPLLADAELPDWVLSQLRTADRAGAGSGRAGLLPPVAALLSNSGGEQWLLCCDALATASVSANLGSSWPKQPQGLRCFYRRGSSVLSAVHERVAAKQAAAAEAAKKAAEAAAGGGSSTGQPAVRRRTSSVRKMHFANTPIVPPQIAALADVEAGGFGPGGGAGLRALRAARNEIERVASGHLAGAGNGSLNRGLSTEALAAAAAAWCQQSAVPDWAVGLLEAVSVSCAAASAEAAACHVPGDLDLQVAKQSGGRVVAHTAQLPDAGLSRAWLWWAWNQGSEGMNKLLAPPPPPRSARAAERAGGAAGKLKQLLGRRLHALSARLRRRKGGAEADEEDRQREKQPRLAPVFDGLLTTVVEEAVLRGEPLLAGYWRAYDALDGAGCRAAVEGPDVQLIQVRFSVFGWGLSWVKISPVSCSQVIPILTSKTSCPSNTPHTVCHRVCHHVQHPLAAQPHDAQPGHPGGLQLRAGQLLQVRRGGHVCLFSC
jgi:hypothetical protein